MRFKNDLKTIAVLLAFLVSSSAFADGLTTGGTPGYWMDDTDVFQGIDFGNGESAEWRIGHDILGYNIFCASSWVDSDVNNASWPFCISYEAPPFRLKVGPLGVGIGTFSPASDLHMKNEAGPVNVMYENADGDHLFYHAAVDAANDQAYGEGFWGLFTETLNGVELPLLVHRDAKSGGLWLTEDATALLAGNLGVGIESPAEAVDVMRTEEAARFMLTAYTSTGSEAPQYIQRRAYGSYTNPEAMPSGQNLGIFSFRGYTGSGWTGSKALITVQTAEAWTPTSTGTKMKFYTAQNGGTSISEVMELTHDGHIKVGGTQLNVPDYVFEEDYELMPLDDLHAYVMKERHLPDVPSEATIRAEGLNVTKTQMLLLQKIEELTLYTIQQQEQLKAQNERFLSQQKEVETQRNQINLLEKKLSRLATQSN